MVRLDTFKASLIIISVQESIFLSTYKMPNTIPHPVFINMSKYDFSVELTLC